MKKTISVLMAFILTVGLIPLVAGIDTGVGIGIDIETEDFETRLWLCDSRVMYDDYVEAGRTSDGGEELFERVNNYAFEGEQIVWNVLAFDKNGVEKIEDVFVVVSDTPNDIQDNLDDTMIEANCYRSSSTSIDSSCNARIDEEIIDTFDPDTMQNYVCEFTVETPGADCDDTTTGPNLNDPVVGNCAGMWGERWVSIMACDLDLDGDFNEAQCSTIDENEFWFFNPVIALGVDDGSGGNGLDFGIVRPGTSSYSSTVLVSNEADAGSGVLLDMFITGTDFFDSMNSGARCPVSNVLRLGDGDSTCDVGADFGGADASTDAFCYYATNGAYSTAADGRSDAEGYVGILYGDRFTTGLYGTAATDPTGGELIQNPLTYGATAPYYRPNILTPGAEMALTFRLNLPEPCNGDFDSGDIFFWAEAI